MQHINLEEFRGISNDSRLNMFWVAFDCEVYKRKIIGLKSWYSAHCCNSTNLLNLFPYSSHAISNLSEGETFCQAQLRQEHMSAAIALLVCS